MNLIYVHVSGRRGDGGGGVRTRVAAVRLRSLSQGHSLRLLACPARSIKTCVYLPAQKASSVASVDSQAPRRVCVFHLRSCVLVCMLPAALFYNSHIQVFHLPATLPPACFQRQVVHWTYGYYRSLCQGADGSCTGHTQGPYGLYGQRRMIPRFRIYHPRSCYHPHSSSSPRCSG